MLESKLRVAVWILDEWGRALMAAPPAEPDGPVSRWVAGDEKEIGFKPDR